MDCCFLQFLYIIYNKVYVGFVIDLRQDLQKSCIKI